VVRRVDERKRQHLVGGLGQCGRAFVPLIRDISSAKNVCSKAYGAFLRRGSRGGLLEYLQRFTVPRVGQKSCAENQVRACSSGLMNFDRQEIIADMNRARWKQEGFVVGAVNRGIGGKRLKR